MSHDTTFSHVKKFEFQSEKKGLARPTVDQLSDGDSKGFSTPTSCVPTRVAVLLRDVRDEPGDRFNGRFARKPC